jgi:hypothetical protein
MLSSSLNHYNALALLSVQTSKSYLFLSHIAHQGNHRGVHPVQTRQGRGMGSLHCQPDGDRKAPHAGC